MNKCHVEMMKWKMNWMQDATGGKQDFSLCIAKISQGLRKFRKDCENFATIAKILQSLRNFRYEHFFAMHIFSLSERNFAIIAKVTVHSENLNFP